MRKLLSGVDIILTYTQTNIHIENKHVGIGRVDAKFSLQIIEVARVAVRFTLAQFSAHFILTKVFFSWHEAHARTLRELRCARKCF